MSPEFAAVLPGLIMACTGPVILVAIAIRRNHTAAFALFLIGGIASLLALVPALEVAPARIDFLLAIDRFTLFFSGLLVLTCLGIAGLAYAYYATCDESCEEFYALLSLGCTGAITMAASIHFIAFFLGLELLSVTLYVLIGYLRTASDAIEASMKYLILASVSSAFLLLGFAVLYFTYGSMEFRLVGARLADASPLIAAAGIMLILVGAGYKLALVPFHLWTPDVYEGASAPVSAFVAAVPKAAMLAFLYRFLMGTGLGASPPVATAMAVVASASMILGNVLALQQANLKRLLAYSSISHMGYALVALLSAGPAALTGVVFYAVAYSVTLLGAFGVVSALSTAGAEWSEIEDYRALFWRKPAASLLLAGLMLSLAGIPLTIGFIGKFLVLTAGVGSTLWTLSILLVLTSAVGLYFYLRVIVVMFTHSQHHAEAAMPRIRVSDGIVLTAVAVLLFVLGIYPDPLVSLIQTISILPR